MKLYHIIHTFHGKWWIYPFQFDILLKLFQTRKVIALFLSLGTLADSLNSIRHFTKAKRDFISLKFSLKLEGNVAAWCMRMSGFLLIFAIGIIEVCLAIDFYWKSNVCKFKLLIA